MRKQIHVTSMHETHAKEMIFDELIELNERESLLAHLNNTTMQ